MTQFKKGDRVRYVGNNVGEYQSSGYKGREGTVTKLGLSLTSVQWDGLNENSVFTVNLELITMNAINIAKPLQLLTRGGDPKDVTLLARLPNDNLIINTYGAGKDTHWAEFDRYGNFIRTPSGGGQALSLRNKPVAVSHLFKLDVHDGTPFFIALEPNSVVADLQVWVEDGKVTKTELLR